MSKSAGAATPITTANAETKEVFYMKTEELTALGLTEEQVKAVFALNGKDIEKQKKIATDLESERDNYKSQFEAADAALKKFEGIDPEKIQSEIQSYKNQLETQKKSYEKQLTQRDQKDWIEKRLTEYGVASPFARKQLTSDIMAEDSGLSWKDGVYFGFDDFMKSAKEKDNGLYQTAEEKAAAEKEAAQRAEAPIFTGPMGDPDPKPGKFVPPVIF